jgi:CRP-like cAMP-binding protein
MFYRIDLPIFLNTDVSIGQALRILNTAALEASPKFSPANAPAPFVRINQITLHGVEYFIHIYPTFETRDDAKDLVQKNVLRYLNYAKLAPALEKVEEHAPATVINKMQHVANLLGAIDIFQDLSVPDLDLLANLAQLKSLSAGIVVAQGGEIANSLFLVIEGLLEPEDWRKKDTKNSVAKFIIGPGTLINATTLIAGGVCESTIRTKSSVLLYEISYSAIEQLFLQNPQSASYLSLRVAERLRSNFADNNAGYKQLGIESNVDELYEKVFKNLRRLYAHLRLVDITSDAG